jgi:hypothetical protein
LAIDPEESAMNGTQPTLTPQLARRIAELRGCDNISELHIVGLYDSGARALVRIVPRPCGDASSDAQWQRPAQPFLLLIDPAALSEHALH